MLQIFSWGTAKKILGATVIEVLKNKWTGKIIITRKYYVTVKIEILIIKVKIHFYINLCTWSAKECEILTPK